MLPRLKVALASAAGVVAAGGIVVGVALAQTPSPTQPNQFSAWLTRFAQAIGKPEADVKAAAQQATNQTIDDAVKAGKLTADQAQRLKDRAAQAPFPMPFGRFEGRGHGRPGPFGGRGPGGPGVFGNNGIAQFLNMQPADLMQALRSGKTLAQVAQDHGKSRDDLKNYLTTQAKSRFDQAVKDGRITQDQENQMLQNLSSRLDQMIDGTMPPHGPKGRPGWGRPGGATPQSPSGTQSPSRTSA